MKNIAIKVLNHLGYKFQIIVDKPQQTIIRLGMQLDNGRAPVFDAGTPKFTIQIALPVLFVLLSKKDFL